MNIYSGIANIFKGKSSMQPGKFIVIEGLEGAGKTTAHQYVVELLKAHGITQIISTREPGGTPLAEKLRQLIKHENEETITDKAELLMLYAARVQLVENVIKPAMENGVWVVGDRHDWSSQAYQGGGRGMDKTLMQTLRAAVLGDFKPDFVLYLDIDPVQGLARARGRGELDRIENQAVDFFTRTREAYLDLMEREPMAKLINAGESLDNVKAQIKLAIENFLKNMQ